MRRESNTHTELVIRHEPETEPGRPADTSHSGVYGVPEDDIAIRELLVTSVQSLVPAR